MAATRVSPGGGDGEINLTVLDKLNVAQATSSNKEILDQLGGLQALAAKLHVSLEKGLTEQQAAEMREKYGANVFPSPPMATWLEEFFDALKDPIVMVLIAAATVSLIIGLIEDPHEGYIEGTAIVIAVLLVATVTATNNYNKERQFRSLEATSHKDERVFIKRGNELKFNSPDDIVVGDLVKLKAGDGIPADGILVEGEGVKANESSLTGEPDDLPKHHSKDPFLLSSSLLTDQGTSPEVFMFVIAVGARSQWGKIRANLVQEATPTPLQEKLEEAAKLIGKLGTAISIFTFIALVAMIWNHHPHPTRTTIVAGVVESFIIAVTIVVVSIPEGLPLAVTISLAYSTKKMYKDNNLIRVLAACETMGNATNICSDKTGTLTENRMTVVEGWFGGVVYSDVKGCGDKLNKNLKEALAVNFAVNSAANVLFTSEEGKPLHRPKVIGSATEGALLLMIHAWGINFVDYKAQHYTKETDKIFPFNSGKKRATAIVKRPDGTVRVLVKGATEWVLNDCTQYLKDDGTVAPLTDSLRKTIGDQVLSMADRALRTLCIAHRDFSSASKLPADWDSQPPDNAELVCDGIVGIIDPLRDDVKEAVATAQRAGVMVRMITGDNINTAKAIARDCGILTPGGLAIEGPVFRNLTPAQLDQLLPRIQVMARSSPEDKYLMVTRLNGSNLPKDERTWLEKHPGRSWATEKDLLLPGYYDEWIRSRPDGGHIVGVTGDGTNDAPALKAADVGLSMGITGTQVAKNASDIVILDDKFSSIVRAIMWGRAVYDNIRKFLQFQLTVNVVALVTVFVGAVTGNGTPLNAVMMLWVNLIMDTLGALALGTEEPTKELLNRRPYKRTSALLSRPMIRNIIAQSMWQIAFLFFLLFKGPDVFGLATGDYCEDWSIGSTSVAKSFSYKDKQYSCADFHTTCDADYNKETGVCYLKVFSHIKDYSDICNMSCNKYDFTHYTFMFTAFVFCQIFNEFNARELFNGLNVFKGLTRNPIFLWIILFTGGMQALIVQVGGMFVRTQPLRADLWGWSILFGIISLPWALIVKLILPLNEAESTFFGYELPRADDPVPPELAQFVSGYTNSGTAKVVDHHV